jgi:NADH:ubiquinone oxidoreductase subunit 4 (subunit M)
MNLIIGLFALLTNTNFQMVNIFLLVHGMLSALLFFLIDQIQKRYQTRNLIEMSGLATFTVILHVVI